MSKVTKAAVSLSERLERLVCWSDMKTPELQWIRKKQALAEVQKVASQIQEERDGAFEWVKENLLKASYEGREDEDLDWVAKDMCHAIQVFVNRVVLPKLVGEDKK